MVREKLSGLSEANEKKKIEALSKVEQAISNLVADKQKITIRSVAREARVSVSYIYKYPELTYKIQRLREQQKYSLVKSDRANLKKNKELEMLKQEQAELKLEIVELKAIIERTKTGKNSLKELKEKNIQLAQENIKLKKELEYTLQNLQSAREFILEQGRIEIEQPKLELKLKKVRQISEE